MLLDTAIPLVQCSTEYCMWLTSFSILSHSYSFLAAPEPEPLVAAQVVRAAHAVALFQLLERSGATRANCAHKPTCLRVLFALLSLSFPFRFVPFPFELKYNILYNQVQYTCLLYST